MEQWVINTLIFTGVIVFTSLCSLVIGYIMGRNSADKPIMSHPFPTILPFDPGSTSMSSDADIFKQAMEGPSDDKRVATIKE